MFERKTDKQGKSNISALAHINTMTEEERLEAEAQESEGVGDVNGDGEVNVADYMPEGRMPQESGSKVKRIEHTEPKFTIVAKPDRTTMFRFMVYHSYANLLGVLSVLIGIGAITMVVISIVQKAGSLQIILFGIVAVMFISNSPLGLWFKAKKQSAIISDEKNAITYTFSDEGFDMSRGEDEYADFEWSHMYKVKEGELGYYMYLEKNRAFVVPKADLEAGSEAEFRSLLKRHVEKRLELTDKSAEG